MAGMLRASVAIRSADPATGDAITVTVTGSDAVWHPAAAVVFVGRSASECAGPSAVICCGYINFFARHSAAAVWAAAHPEVTDGILSQDRALEVGEQISGRCSSETSRQGSSAGQARSFTRKSVVIKAGKSPASSRDRLMCRERRLAARDTYFQCRSTVLA